MFKFPTKASLDSYISGTTPKAGIHTVEVDETFYNEKIEYMYKNSVLTRLSNPKIEFIKRDNVNTFAEVAAITSPINKNMVVVLKDESTFSKTTWYTYNVSQWVFMGEYLGSKIEKVVSIDGERTAVIHENTDFTIPGTLKYTVGRNELSIYVGGIKLTSTDFIEVGLSGVLSNIVQFTSAILTGMEIEFIREVHNNQTIDPSYQIVQQKIHDETLEDQRMHIVSARGYNYGGTIQACRNQDPTKVYWCNVNKKFYYPKPVSIVPTMSALTSGVITVSASSTHVAPFPAWLAFDANESTFWHNIDDGSPISATNTEWIQVDFGVATPITHILIYPRLRNCNEYMFPCTYDILGSSDGTTWNTIKTVTDNITLYGNNNGNPGSAVNKCPASYRYYRILIKKVNANGLAGEANDCPIGRLELLNNADSSWTIADASWVEFNIYERKSYLIYSRQLSTINIPTAYRHWLEIKFSVIKDTSGWNTCGSISRYNAESFVYGTYATTTTPGITQVLRLADRSAIYINTGNTTFGANMVFNDMVELFFD